MSASIPLPALATRPPEQQPGPMDTYGRALQIKGAQQQLQAGQMENQVRALQLHDQQAMTAAMQEWDGKDYNALPGLVLKNKGSAQAVLGLRSSIVKQQQELANLTKDQLANEKIKNDYFAQQLENVKQLPPEQQGQAFEMAKADAVQRGHLDPQQAQGLQYQGPQQLDVLEKSLLGYSGALSAAEKQQTMANQAQEMKNKQALFPGQLAESRMKEQEASLSPLERALKNQNALEYYAAKGDPMAQQALQKRIEVAKASRPNINMMQPNDPKDIADGIVSGQLPPTTKGLYRNAAPVMAELSRRGFNLQRAESDWNAVQKHISTLNGAQQERLRQAVTFTYDSLDNIENLYNEWKQLGPNSGFKAFNKAALAASKQLPGRTGAVAQALEAQINDLTSELGTVYKGGNASTDETLRLASENLKADWNEETFRRGLQQIRTNLGIRKNSILNSQPVGMSANSPYNPTPAKSGKDNDPLGIR